MKLSAKAYIADELANKVFYLHKALEQSKLIIQTLEEENCRLKEILEQLMKSSLSCPDDRANFLNPAS